MYSNFTEEARKILVSAKKEMYDLKHPYVGSEHLLLAILKDNNNISKKLLEYKLDYKKFKDEIIKIIGKGSNKSELFLYTPLLKRILDSACLDSKENNNGEVTIEHLFTSMLEEGEGVAIRILLQMNIDLDELYNEFSYNFTSKKRKKNKKLLLEELGVDITKQAKEGLLDRAVLRDSEIRRVLEVLSRRNKNNPILIGKAGVGKTAIVEEIANMIANDNVPPLLKNKKIISLDMATAVAGTKYRGEFEERISKILKEVEENEDIILFIDEIHTLVGAGGAEGAIDASNIFKPALSRGKLRCIGSTTTEEYKKYIEKDGALERRFQRIEIEEPDMETTKKIIMNVKETYEKFHHTNISEDVVDTIVNLSSKYIYNRNEPDKSLDILDEVCAKVNLEESSEYKKYSQLKYEYQKLVNKKNKAIKQNKYEEASKIKKLENNILSEINQLELNLNQNRIKEVTKIDVAKVVNLKTNIPIYELVEDYGMTISNIENSLKESIYGQDKAIKEVINIAKKIKLGYKDNKCYSFLFMGPSGVGKTVLAKNFASLLANKNVIKLDMSEYSEAHSVSKIVGAPPGYVGYDDNHNILEEIKNKPYSVLILDEIERANPAVINLFYQILDEGKIKDSSGRIVRFDNVIIIMTSNIGFSNTHVGFNEITNKTVTGKLKEYFSTSFINRIDNIVIFDKLDKESINKIVSKKLCDIKDKYSVKIDKKVINEIIELTNYKEFGARRIDKIIKDKLENIIIDLKINNSSNMSIKTIKEKSTV